MNIAINLEMRASSRGKGSVIRKPGSRKLYVSFRYFGKRIEKSTGLSDNAKNQEKVRQWLDRVIERIEEGSFKFAEAFPGASEEEKAVFSKLEGWEYKPEPNNVVFGEYVDTWLDNIWTTYHSVNKRRDYKQVIDNWLIPQFGEKTFYQITRVSVQRFIAQLKWQTGSKVGLPLSRSRIRNIFIPLRAIWNDACDEYRWDLSDPFRNLAKHMPVTAKKEMQVFRFDEWIQLLDQMEPHFKTIAEVMIMTGMISSEISGLKRDDIEGSHLAIRHSRVRGMEKDELKTPFRKRRIPITKALRLRLDEALTRSKGEHVFSMKSGQPFLEGSFRQNPWTRAFQNASLVYKVPYTMRHSFAAWALTLRMDPNRLVHLMGHSSKKMVYDVYGGYVEGLEKDVEKICGYFGEDFISQKRIATPTVFGWNGESFGESQYLAVAK